MNYPTTWEKPTLFHVETSFHRCAIRPSITRDNHPAFGRTLCDEDHNTNLIRSHILSRLPPGSFPTRVHWPACFLRPWEIRSRAAVGKLSFGNTRVKSSLISREIHTEPQGGVEGEVGLGASREPIWTRSKPFWPGHVTDMSHSGRRPWNIQRKHRMWLSPPLKATSFYVRVGGGGLISHNAGSHAPH